MSLADRQKNAADGLFMLGMCTVTVTFLLLGNFHPEQKHLFPPFGGLKKSKSAAIHIQEPDGWFGARVISLAITFNQVHFFSQLKGFAIGKKFFFFIRKTARILRRLRTQNLNKWVEAHLTSTPQRDDGKLQQKGAWLLKVAERAFSGKAPHHTILRYLSNWLSDEILHRGIQWMDAYWCQYWDNGPF